jgi:two-component system response regulator NreC
MTKVLIADDHAVVRAGLRALIKSEPSLELVGEASGGHETIELVNQHKPDILVLDISMPDLDGIAVTKTITSELPDVRILILTLHEDKALLRETLKLGAAGYILKRAAETELITAIQVVMRGDMYVDPSLVHTLIEAPEKSDNSIPHTHESLTPRELEVLRLIALGYTNRQIGEELSISVRTAEGHRANLSDKLGISSRVELVRYALELGLIDT